MFSNNLYNLKTLRCLYPLLPLDPVDEVPEQPDGVALHPVCDCWSGCSCVVLWVPAVPGDYFCSSWGCQEYSPGNLVLASVIVRQVHSGQLDSIFLGRHPPAKRHLACSHHHPHYCVLDHLAPSDLLKTENLHCYSSHTARIQGCGPDVLHLALSSHSFSPPTSEYRIWLSELFFFSSYRLWLAGSC